MQHLILIVIVLAWLVICGTFSQLITGTSHMSGALFIWVILVNTPFLLKPINWARSQLNKRACIQASHKNGNRIFIHLSPWQATVNIPPDRVCWFWDGLFENLGDALRRTKGCVVIASHLLTHRRAKRILSALPPNGYKTRLTSVPFSPFARAILQLEVLVTQWRWISVNRTSWPVLVIRKKSLKAL